MWGGGNWAVEKGVGEIKKWLLCVQEAMKDGRKGSTSAKEQFVLLDLGGVVRSTTNPILPWSEAAWITEVARDFQVPSLLW